MTWCLRVGFGQGFTIISISKYNLSRKLSILITIKLFTKECVTRNDPILILYFIKIVSPKVLKKDIGMNRVINNLYWRIWSSSYYLFTKRHLIYD